MTAVRFLQIEPTTRCNFTCGFCCGRSMAQADLPFERFVEALDALPALAHIELQGEGESLMHPRFFDMVALARQRGIKVSFISNGSYLHREVATRVVQAGIEKVSVSLESADPATFQRIRGGKLEKVLRGIETLLDVRRELSSARPVVGFSVTVLRSTRGELPAILALYRRLGLDGGVTVQPLQRMESYVRTYAPEMEAELLSQEEVDDLWVGYRMDRELARIGRERAPVQSFFDEMMVGWRAGVRSCPWLDGGLYLNNEGEASACCMVKDTGRLGFGKLGREQPAEILSRREEMRAQLAAGQVPEACKGCELARFAVMTRPQLMSFGVRGMWRRWFGGKKDAAGEKRGLKVISG